MRQAVLAGLLNVEIERELNVAAGLCGNGIRATGHGTRCIYLNGLLASNSLKQMLVLQLHTRLAHDVARLVGDGRRPGLFVRIVG